ncbi:MAG: hypothetical protein K6G55_04730 [Selenomonadaceae bacterium]|nr:hypothetical protein [Selenomonadaceae bacterium]
MMLEERFMETDFSQMSRVKNSLLMRLKLRRRAINEEMNEQMSFEELDEIAAAGNPNLQKKDDKDNLK